ncbi:hypothetical protein PanWU01x14_108810, partial [Parasponia andersonii]
MELEGHMAVGCLGTTWILTSLAQLVLSWIAPEIVTAILDIDVVCSKKVIMEK